MSSDRPKRSPSAEGPLGGGPPERSTLEIRLLGGFQVVLRGRQLEGFESQKVRALCAYLACQADRPHSRDQLADLLWPEEGQETARRNLRQAVYNLRRALASGTEAGWEPIEATHQALRIAPETDCWLDVRAFDGAVARGLARDDVLGTHELARASELYRGDFLAGFHVKGGDSFEEWLLGEQERLREAAIQALKTLVERFAARGEFRYAIGHARRLVEMDPLSEGSHRDLMRLYALSGRRSRALAQFEELGELLERELGVAPLKETRDLYQAILTEGLPEEHVRQAAQSLGPFVTLAGRGEALERLGESLERAVEGGARLALVAGEAGVGKTRLVRTFLHQATARRKATVLQGRCYEAAPPRAVEPVAEALRAVLAGDLDDELPRGRTARQLAARLAACLEPPAAAEAEPPADPADPTEMGEELGVLVARLFEHLVGRDEGAPVPLILYLDDLHLAPGPSVELVLGLVDRLAGLPVWVVATCDRAAGVSRDHPLAALNASAAGGEGAAGRIDHIGLGRLDGDAVAEIAGALVDADDEEELTAILTRTAGGLPLHLVELINFLSDEGALVAVSERRWALAGDHRPAEVLPAGSLAELIVRRGGRLPTSTRRLLALATVIGQTFDADLLQAAADEHLGVVEIGIELMLERWLIRQFPRYWTARPRERDLVLWAHGARRGTFEFAHPLIRDAIYRDLNPLRRQHLHRQVATALEVRRREGDGVAVETLGYHFARAGEWRRALPHLARAAEEAARLADPETAAFYAGLALKAPEQPDDPEAEAARQALAARRAGTDRHPRRRPG